MNGLVTRRIMVNDQPVELWESPDAPFDATSQALARYAVTGAWIALFNALALRSAILRAE